MKEYSVHTTNPGWSASFPYHTHPTTRRLAGYSTGGGSANIGAVSTLIYELDTPFSGGSNLAGKDPRPRIFFDTPHAFLVT